MTNKSIRNLMVTLNGDKIVQNTTELLGRAGDNCATIVSIDVNSILAIWQDAKFNIIIQKKPFDGEASTTIPVVINANADDSGLIHWTVEEGITDVASTIHMTVYAVQDDTLRVTSQSKTYIVNESPMTASIPGEYQPSWMTQVLEAEATVHQTMIDVQETEATVHQTMIDVQETEAKVHLIQGNIAAIAGEITSALNAVTALTAKINAISFNLDANGYLSVTIPD